MGGARPRTSRQNEPGSRGRSPRRNQTEHQNSKRPAGNRGAFSLFRVPAGGPRNRGGISSALPEATRSENGCGLFISATQNPFCLARQRVFSRPCRAWESGPFARFRHKITPLCAGLFASAFYASRFSNFPKTRRIPICGRTFFLASISCKPAG